MNIVHQNKNKIWFIQVDGLKEGPYSIIELKSHPKMTPDTPVQKQGTDQWVLARFIPELQVIFEDEKDLIEVKEPNWQPLPTDDDTAVLTQNSPSFYIWILIVLIFVAYVYFLTRYY